MLRSVNDFWLVANRCQMGKFCSYFSDPFQQKRADEDHIMFATNRQYACVRIN